MTVVRFSTCFTCMADYTLPLNRQNNALCVEPSRSLSEEASVA